jgi:hypothetical protein
MDKIKFRNPAYEVEADDLEEFLYLNAKYEVCDLCDGKGTTVNPAIDHYGITNEDFDEDPDFRENYFSGVYDVACRRCEGLRVMLAPDEENNPPELLNLYWQSEREKYDYARERYAEMRAEGQEVYMSDFGY